jgi:hypothetical protein
MFYNETDGMFMIQVPANFRGFGPKGTSAVDIKRKQYKFNATSFL